MLAWPSKTPTMTADYAIDWSRELLPGETITAQTFMLTAGSIALGTVANVGNQTSVVISGGLDGQCCQVKGEITTSEGNTYDQCVEILISCCGDDTITTTSKRTIVEMAYEEIGLPGYSFAQTPEELVSGMRRLDAMMSEWPCAVKLGYNFPVSIGTSDPDDPSGLPDFALAAVYGGLAVKLSPMQGKTLSGEAKAAASRAYGVMLGRLGAPTMQLARGTPRGSGNYISRWAPFVAVPIVPMEGRV